MNVHIRGSACRRALRLPMGAEMATAHHTNARLTRLILTGSSGAVENCVTASHNTSSTEDDSAEDSG